MRRQFLDKGVLGRQHGTLMGNGETEGVNPLKESWELGRGTGILGDPLTLGQELGVG